MKKSRLVLTLTMALLTLCLSLCFVACGGKTTTIGGESGEDVENKYEIVGAVDIHISEEVNDISVYTNKVKATNGENSAVCSVDASAVSFGTNGTYKLTYTYEDLSEEVSVYIYDTPTINLASDAKTTYPYSEFYLGVADGITATDSFGNELDVRIFDNKGAQNNDGSLIVGSYSFTFAAVDMAGQIVYVDKDVTITAEKSPVVESSYTYDVEKETYEIALSEEDYDSFLSISLAGATIPNQYIVKENGKVTIDGNYLFSVVRPGQTVEMRVLTAFGYASTTFTLTDQAPVSYSDEELELFCSKTYECFEDLILPAVEITNPRQTEKITYEVYKDGELYSEGRAVNFLKDGDYTLKVKIRGVEVSFDMKSFYNIGFATGRAYTTKDGLVAQIKEGYNLVSYKVESIARETLLTYDAASDTDGSKFEEFNTKFKKLDRRYSYILTATVSHEDYGTISQTCDFSVVTEGTTVIASEKKHLDEGAVYTYYPEKATLEVEYGNIGGRTSAFRWETLGNFGANEVLWTFAKTNSSVLKKGMYLTFDLYVSAGITLTWFANGNNHYIYNSVSTLPKHIAFYDSKSEKITSGSIWDGSFNNKWITIQIQLECDYEFGSNWRGMGTATNTTFNKFIYLANFMVSSKSREYINHTCDNFDQQVISSDYLRTDANCDTYATYYYSCICGESAKDNENIADDDAKKYFVYEEGGYKHTFDREVATDDYLASTSTCSKLATYYYSCECGAKGTQTFEYGELGTVHNFDQKIDTEEFATGTTDSETGKPLYYYSCLCGMSSKGTDEEATFAFNQVAPKEDALVILATKADLDNGNVYPRLGDKVSLDWVENGGGRDGVFQWHSDVANLAANDTYLWVANGFHSSLGAGKYISFDIYASSDLNFYIPLPEIKVWYSDNDGTLEANGIRFYDENGNRITSGKWSNGDFKNQWITVEVRLPENYQNSAWRGLIGIYHAGKGALNNTTIYLDNIVAYSKSRG